MSKKYDPWVAVVAVLVGIAAGAVVTAAAIKLARWMAYLD